MKFISLTANDLMSLRDSQNRNSYCDGLALIDDLLCGFDPERLPPSFLPDFALKQGVMPGDEALIVSEVDGCMARMRSDNLTKNIYDNLAVARELRSLVAQNHLVALGRIRVFLSDLLAQYAVVIHPVFSSRDS